MQLVLPRTLTLSPSDGAREENSPVLRLSRLLFLVAAFLVSLRVGAAQSTAVLQFGSSNYVVAENGVAAQLLVTRSGNLATQVSVNYATVGGTAQAGADYLEQSGALTFAAGETQKSIGITILDDGRVEGDESLELTLSNPSAGAALGTPSKTVLTIHDNEFPLHLADPAFNSPIISGVVNSIAAQPDGKILVVGYFTEVNGGAHSGLARLNSNGTVDSSFRFPTTLDPLISVSGMRLEPGGAILISGYVPQPNSSVAFGVARLHEDGSLDTNFHSRIDVSGASSLFIQTMAVQPDRKILLGGSFDSVNGVPQENLARLNPDGTLDPDFKVTVRPLKYIYGYEPAFVGGIVLQSDGRILVSGNFRSINGVGLNGAVRLNVDGSVDLSFSPPEYPSVRFLAVQKDGRILMATPNGIARLNPDGSSDGTFMGPPNATAWWRPESFTLQPDGSMIFISSFGQFGAPNTVTRLKADGSIDTSFPSFTFPRVPNRGGPYLNALVVQPDGKIVVGGNFTTVNDIPRGGIARLFGNGDGPPALQFTTSHATVAEGEGLAVISVERSGDTSQPATVQYRTKDGTARANSDYLPQADTLNFAPLETVKTIIVPIIDNPLPGIEKDLSLILSNPSEGAANFTRTTLTLTIADDERPGSLDWTFDPVIEATKAYPSGPRVALQPDGRLILAGDFQRVNGVPRNGICRLNPDGSLDESFNPGSGLSLKSSDGNLQAAEIFALAAQADGKVLVAGSFNFVNGLSYSNLVRLNPDGTVDTGFVPDRLLAGSVSAEGVGIIVQRNGKIVIGISNRRPLHADGWVLEQKLSSTDIGSAYPISTRVARLRPDGSFDPSFQDITVAGGRRFEFEPRFARFLAQQPDGRILVEGSIDRTAPSAPSLARGLLRLNTDGSIDESFPPFSAPASLSAAAVRFDGKIAIAGVFDSGNGGYRSEVAQLNADGSLDRTFSGPDQLYDGIALAYQSDGKILVATAHGSVERLNASGSIDPSFNVGNPGFEPNGYSTIWDLVALPNGQVIISGTFNSVNGRTRLGLARLNGDLQLANQGPRFSRIIREANGSVEFTVEVVPGLRYTLQASTDLVTWTSLNTVTATNYILNLQDTRAPSFQRRFYRLQLAP